MQPQRPISIVPSARGESVPAQAPKPAGDAEGRPWIGVRFVCAGAYIRVFRNVQGTGYVAGCPRCGRVMRFRVGPGGTSSRFFDVSC